MLACDIVREPMVDRRGKRVLQDLSDMDRYLCEEAPRACFEPDGVLRLSFHGPGSTSLVLEGDLAYDAADVALNHMNGICWTSAPSPAQVMDLIKHLHPGTDERGIILGNNLRLRTKGDVLVLYGSGDGVVATGWLNMEQRRDLAECHGLSPEMRTQFGWMMAPGKIRNHLCNNTDFMDMECGLPGSVKMDGTAAVWQVQGVEFRLQGEILTIDGGDENFVESAPSMGAIMDVLQLPDDVFPSVPGCCGTAVARL